MPRQPFHLVGPSPWPLLTAGAALSMTFGVTMWFHGLGVICLTAGLLLLLLCMYQWWRDIVRESLMGKHTNRVMSGLRVGMVLFIVSEVMFFFSFFWAYFHSSLAPSVELGCMWPPQGVKALSPFQIPLLNTVVLLASGVSLTYSHHSLIIGDRFTAEKSLMITVALGVYFISLQAYEYYTVSFTIADSVYGSVFFVMTGFHGLHVIIGTIFLFIILIRVKGEHFSTNSHFGFEASAWYWHFVDVVWILLFICVYWWGF